MKKLLCLVVLFFAVITIASADMPGSGPWFIGLDNGVYHPAGQSYARIGLGSATALAVLGGTPYVVGNDGQIWMSPSGNGTWNVTMPGVRAQRITFDDGGTMFLVGTDSGVYAMADGKLRRVGLGLAQDIAVRSGTIYVIGSDGRVWTSSMKGDWRPYNVLAKGTRIAVGRDGGVYIVGTDNGVYRITPANIERIGLASATSLAVSGDGTIYIIGTDTFVWSYANGSWQRWGQNPAKAVVWPR